MLDKGHEMTDEILSELEKKIHATYSQAVKEMTEKVDSKLAKYSESLEKKQAQLAEGKITKKEFDTWKKNQAAMVGNIKDLRDTLAEDLVHTDQIAADIINDYTPEVFALNMNYGTYQVEKLANVKTSFVLYNKDTVNYLIAENPDLLPKAKINIPKDMKWNKQHVGNAVTQGILQGENSYKIAKRLQQVTDMDNRAAIRNARTMVTNAQSTGRVRSYKRAQKMGINVRHKWSSIHDARTRHSHVRLDGEVRDLDEAFSNGLMFPGDSNGPGYEVYNCRCRVVPVLKGHEKDNEVNGSGFEKWKGDQAAPDSAIQSIWGNKGWSKVFYEIYDKDHAAANAFKKELTALADQKGLTPKDVWAQYMKSELDPDELAKFEGILKKYLPEQSISTGVTSTATKTIAKEALDAEKKLNVVKGEAMDIEHADNYKVNPLYNKGDFGTTHNCQTSTFAYECRRQGYDVTALPKCVDKDGNPLSGFEAIGTKQKELAMDQSVGWINKTTGQPPKMLYGGNASVENIEKIIGKNGERYSMSVKWNKGGGHVVNVERDANGVIWVIDNQRGSAEINRWTLEDYLKKDIKQIGRIHRLDDCVPNPEFFNLIVKDNTSKVAIKTGVKNTGEKTIDVFGKKFTKQDLLKMNDDDLWETLSNIKDESWLDKFDGPNFKKDVLSELFDADDIATEVESVFGKYSMSAVYKELQEQGLHNEFYNKILKSMGKQSEVWKKYVANELDPSDAAKIDDFLIKHLKNTGKIDDVTDIAKAVSAIDIDGLKTKSLMQVYDELKEDKLHGKFYSELKDIGQTKGLGKQGDVWKKYLAGELDAEDVAKIEKYLDKYKAADTVAIVPEVDLFALQGKSMSQVFKELKEDGLNNKFYNELKKYGKPSDVFEKYLNGELSEDANKKIDDILIKKYSKGGQTTKTLQTIEKSEELIEAEKKLAEAEKDFKAAEKALKDNVDTSTKWSGIWKKDVTLDDYSDKKSKIADKKQYYQDQIKDYEDKINSGYYANEGGKKWAEDKILEFETYIDDLDEYDQLGKYAEKYYKDIKKAKEAVTKAQQEVQALTPVGEAFTEERKANALWVKSKSGEDFNEADKYYETVASKVHGSKTAIEHEGYYRYTGGSGPFNRPLAGFEGSWSQSAFKGVGKVDIDSNGYGDKIRGLTSLIEKSTYDRDVWLQSGQYQITLESFLGIKPGTLKNMTEEQLQQFVGVQNEIPQFISTSINRGGGSYNPGDMVFNIYCPRGSEILYVRSDGFFGKEEHEMILQRGGTYKISKLYWGSDGKLYVDLEVHPECGYDKFQQIK